MELNFLGCILIVNKDLLIYVLELQSSIISNIITGMLELDEIYLMLWEYNILSTIIMVIFISVIVHLSGGKIAKEILDVAAKVVGITAGATIIYNNLSGGDNNKDDKDKKDVKSDKAEDKNKGVNNANTKSGDSSKN